MSQLTATITSIDSVENLNIVTFLCAEQKLQMLSLELDTEIKEGTRVTLACKPTSVALAKPTIEVENFCAMLSYANQIPVKIITIDEGKLLSAIVLALGEFRLESILATSALERLKLKEGDEVLALIKANELSILEVHDD